MLCWIWEGWEVWLVDMVGLCKKFKVQECLEKMLIGEIVCLLKYVDVVVLVMELEDFFEKQDLQIVDFVLCEGWVVVFVIFKWDMIKNYGMVMKELE